MPDLKPVYLITGRDRPKIQRAIERLKARFDPSSIEHLSADEASGEEAVAACNTLGLFGGEGKLVLVTEVDGHRNREDRLVGGWKAVDVEVVAAYLADPAPGTVLALVAETARKDSALVKACAKRGEVLVYDVDDRGLVTWIGKQFAELGVKADTDAARVLLDLVGKSRDELRMEIEKLAVWSGGEGVSALDVEELVSPRGPVEPWTLTDAWGQRDVPAVLRAAARLQRRGETPTGLAWKVADHVALVAACRRFAAEGVGPAEATKRLKRRSEFHVKKAFAQAESWDDAELQRVIVRLAELDADLKGGSRLPNDLLLEQALVEVTRGAAPAAA